MFEGIISFFKKFGKAELQDTKSKDMAKERLHLVLMQDRANVSADFLEMMKQEIIDVIKKYITVDESEIDVRLTNKTNEDGTSGAPALYANIPIVSIKNENKKMEKEESNNKEINSKKEEKQKVNDDINKSSEKTEKKSENKENNENTDNEENRENNESKNNSQEDDKNKLKETEIIEKETKEKDVEDDKKKNITSKKTVAKKVTKKTVAKKKA